MGKQTNRNEPRWLWRVKQQPLVAIVATLITICTSIVTVLTLVHEIPIPKKEPAPVRVTQVPIRVEQDFGEQNGLVHGMWLSRGALMRYFGRRDRTTTLLSTSGKSGLCRRERCRLGRS